uniref:GPS domain-containing protein n=1 Tax=Ascaris lumbricoides TaxID=6252 RepID=A0A9J2PZK7_ASCLU
MVCDRHGACSTAETARFVVHHPVNFSTASNQLLLLIESDIESGDIFGALSKLNALRLEHCDSSIAEAYSNRVVIAILNVFKDFSDENSFWEQISWALSMVSELSESVTERLFEALELGRLKYGFSAVSARTKRQSYHKTTKSTKIINEEQASQLMFPFDTLIAANKDVVAMYLQNIIDVISSFCVQVDSSRIMKAAGLCRKESFIAGTGLTFVQAQGVAPSSANFLNTSFAFAGETQKMVRRLSCGVFVCICKKESFIAGTGLTFVQAQGVAPSSANFLNTSFAFAGETQKMISMTAAFKNVYSNYECGTDEEPRICMQICLGTAKITRTAFIKSSYLRSFFFSASYNMIDFNRSTSSFYQVRFVNPVNGSFISLNNGASFRVTIPLESFIPSHYYACFDYSRGIWSNSQCTSSNAKRITNATYAIDCDCISTGIISIFEMNPPTPPPYSSYNDILLTFLLGTSSSPICDEAERSMFVSQISAASGVSASRIVDVMCINDGTSIVRATLRAPFRPSQKSNSYAVQAITRAVDASEGGLLVFTSSRAISVNASVIKRVLNGDGNARRIRLMIDRSYKDVIANDSTTMAIQWLQSISQMTRISIYRFKNPYILVGIVFNFTITVPFEDEVNPLSAEEIAQIIIENTHYGNLKLEGRQGESLPVEVATLADVTELIPINESNTLVLVLTIVVSTFFVCSSTIVAFLVVLKIRTDRLLTMRERLIEQARCTFNYYITRYIEIGIPIETMFGHIARNEFLTFQFTSVEVFKDDIELHNNALSQESVCM